MNLFQNVYDPVCELLAYIEAKAVPIKDQIAAQGWVFGVPGGEFLLLVHKIKVGHTVNKLDPI
jgi:hypothetical protein